MSDSDELDLDGGEPSELDSGSKKPSGLVALLPNLLKFIAIGLAALIFIATVTIITYNVINRNGVSQTIIPESAPYVGIKPQYSMFTSIGVIRTQTRDTVPYTVVVDMVIGYDLNDNAAATEMTARLYELQDFVRSFFRSRTVDELKPEN
ncbi:MAG: flagellar basal body protein FliL, partial [Treponema sp.]|nr:flagellar basal body protein FliL [Treponema sp.]